MIGLSYTKVQLDQAGIQDIEGVLFLFVTQNAFPAIYGVLSLFPLEMPLFFREYKNGIYRSDTYYISKMVSQVGEWHVIHWNFFIVPLTNLFNKLILDGLKLCAIFSSSISLIIYHKVPHLVPSLVSLYSSSACIIPLQDSRQQSLCWKILRITAVLCGLRLFFMEQK